MEENRNTENEKKKTAKSSDKKGKSLSDFIAVHRAEFKKIVWPSRDELTKQTITVIVVSLLVGGIIFAYDSAISYTYEKGISIVKGSNAASSSVDTAGEVPLEGEDTSESESAAEGANAESAPSQQETSESVSE